MKKRIVDLAWSILVMVGVVLMLFSVFGFLDVVMEAFLLASV